MLDQLHRYLNRISRDETPVEQVYGTVTRYGGKNKAIATGARFFCPICNSWYRGFLPFGLNQRRHARCPGCGSLERHRYLWLYLKNTLKLTQHRAKVLHVAPEAPISRNLASLPNLRYTTVDLYDPRATHKMDLTNLTFDSGAFDLIICSHVLEHIENDRKALLEMARVLRAGGQAIILVPIDTQREKTYEDNSIVVPSERLEAFGHPYHVRICGLDYGKRISAAGFSVTTKYSTSFLPHKRRLLRLNKVILYDCRLGE